MQKAIILLFTRSPLYEPLDVTCDAEAPPWRSDPWGRADMLTLKTANTGNNQTSLSCQSLNNPVTTEREGMCVSPTPHVMRLGAACSNHMQLVELVTS